MGEAKIPGDRGTRALSGWAVRRASHYLHAPQPLAETILHLVGVGDLRAEEGKVSGLKLFRTDTTNSGITEVISCLAEIEADVQSLIEAHMETLLGVRFLASEYGTGPVHAGRIDSLGLDENGSPVIAEYKRGVDADVINQGLFYLSWLTDHRAEFEHLVRYRLFGSDMLGLETVASVSGGMQERTGPVGGQRLGRQPTGPVRVDGGAGGRGRRGPARARGRGEPCRAQDVPRVSAAAELRLSLPAAAQQVAGYLKVAPTHVDLVLGFTQDVSGLGHHGTGDLEVQLRTPNDMERVQELFGAAA